jgi:hypothetical protein
MACKPAVMTGDLIETIASRVADSIAAKKA